MPCFFCYSLGAWKKGMREGVPCREICIGGMMGIALMQLLVLYRLCLRTMLPDV